MYDTYISLGFNCEIAFQFKRIGYDESSFFRWAYSPFESTINLIQNDFKDVYLKENLIPDWDSMVEDTKYKISFHTKLLSEEDQQTKNRYFLANYSFDEIHQKEVKKIQYFIKKWDSLVNSDKSVLYIIKPDQDGSQAHAKKLLDLFNHKYPNHQFMIVYLQTQEFQEPDWGFSQLKNIYFPHFAPVEQATNGSVAAWDELFANFPLKQNVKLLSKINSISSIKKALRFLITK
jgi:hypothetical protein